MLVNAWKSCSLGISFLRRSSKRGLKDLLIYEAEKKRI